MSPFRRFLSGALAGLGVSIIALATIGTAAAVSSNNYDSDLKSFGYTVVIDGVAVDFPTLTIDGKTFVITRDGKTAKVVLLEYGSRANLEKDFIVENGKAPRPRTATTAFDGKVLYWNTDSVLVVDYGNGNNKTVAQASAGVFLGEGGTGGSETPTPKPPATGNGTTTANGISDGTLALAGFAAMALVVGGATLFSATRPRGR